MLDIGIFRVGAAAAFRHGRCSVALCKEATMVYKQSVENQAVFSPKGSKQEPQASASLKSC
jgi:hypothetical protein